MSPVSEERDERRLLGSIVAERYRLVELLEVSTHLRASRAPRRRTSHRKA